MLRVRSPSFALWFKMTFQEFVEKVNKAFESPENPGWDKIRILLDALREVRYDLWITIVGQQIDFARLLPFLQSRWSP